MKSKLLAPADYWGVIWAAGKDLWTNGAVTKSNQNSSTLVVGTIFAVMRVKLGLMGQNLSKLGLMWR